MENNAVNQKETSHEHARPTGLPIYNKVQSNVWFVARFGKQSHLAKNYSSKEDMQLQLLHLIGGTRRKIPGERTVLITFNV